MSNSDFGRGHGCKTRVVVGDTFSQTQSNEGIAGISQITFWSVRTPQYAIDYCTGFFLQEKEKSLVLVAKSM